MPNPRPLSLIAAPTNLGLRPPEPTAVPGTAKAPEALRAVGLWDRMANIADDPVADIDVDLARIVAAEKQTSERLLLNVTLVLAVVTTGVLVYEFFWYILAIGAIALAGLIISDNIRELRG